MRYAPRVRSAVVLLVALGACAPSVDGPVAQQHTRDVRDGAALARQIAQLPGAVSAQASLVRPVRDPLGMEEPVLRAEATAIVLVDSATDRAATETAARALMLAMVPQLTAPRVIILATSPHIDYARVGPFAVAGESKLALKITLAFAFALIAALAGWIALRELRR